MINRVAVRYFLLACGFIANLVHAASNDCGKSFESPPAEAAARKSLQSVSPATRLDGGSSLRDANFDTSPDNPRSVMARGRYQVSPDDYSAAVWVEQQGRRLNDPGRIQLVKLMLLKQIEWLGSIPYQACIRVKSDQTLKDQLSQLVLLGRQLQTDVYLNPVGAELLKRIQASRSRLFALAVSARSGDSAASAEIARLAGLVVRDPFTERAVMIEDAYEALLASAYQKARAGSDDAGYALAVLRIESYSDYDARDYLAQVDVQSTMALIGQAIVVAQVADAALKGSADGDAEDRVCGQQGLISDTNERLKTDQCRKEWDAARRDRLGN